MGSVLATNLQVKGRKRLVSVCRKQTLTGPASPRRLVCAPGDDALHCIADQIRKEIPLESRNEQLKKAPKPLKEERKRRFQIEKLEERIAPSCHLNPQGS